LNADFEAKCLPVIFCGGVMQRSVQSLNLGREQKNTKPYYEKNQLKPAATR
jgi:hypothetical protein